MWHSAASAPRTTSRPRGENSSAAVSPDASAQSTLEEAPKDSFPANATASATLSRASSARSSTCTGTPGWLPSSVERRMLRQTPKPRRLKPILASMPASVRVRQDAPSASRTRSSTSAARCAPSQSQFCASKVVPVVLCPGLTATAVHSPQSGTPAFALAAAIFTRSGCASPG